MADHLPKSITDYVAGKNSRDLAKALSGFTADAIVVDEERQHIGPEAIGRWMTETAAQYNDQSRITDAVIAGDRTVVTAQVSGTFPGSPVVLRYAFTLRDGLITQLTIASP